MTRTQKPFTSQYLVLSIMVIVSLACGSSTPDQDQSLPSIEQEQTQQESPPDSTATAKPTLLPPTPTSQPIGLSRANPYPKSEVVQAPNWDIQILEIKRGEDAWIDIQSANMFNDPAPEGMEYILIMIHAKSTYADSGENNIGGCDFDITGDRLINYTCAMASIVEPDPQLDADLFTGGETEGWVAFAVGEGEGNLILIIDEVFNFDEDARRHIALNDGASIVVQSDLASIQPSDLGKDRNNPSSLNETVTSENWELSVAEVIRGDEAWAKVQEVNQFNDPPSEGMEYIAVRVNARYIGTDDEAELINSSFFGSTGSADVLYDAPSVVDPIPSLDISLYPGGEYEGWVVLQAAIGETDVSLVFEPLFDFGSENRRFISLE